jgi:hypothetical protein
MLAPSENTRGGNFVRAKNIEERVGRSIFFENTKSSTRALAKKKYIFF